MHTDQNLRIGAGQLQKHSKIITDKEDQILGDNITIAVIWNNITGLNFKSKRDWLLYLDHMKSCGFISSNFSEIALISGVECIRKTSITGHNETEQ